MAPLAKQFTLSQSRRTGRGGAGKGESSAESVGGWGALVEQSGFPAYALSRPAQLGPPAAPGNLRLRAGDLSGAIVARYRPTRENTMNEVQKATGDPAVEANWAHAGMLRGGKATLTGLTPGALIWIRVRTCGLKGVMGAWSDPAQIRVV
jgi:hypothetical protein